MLWAEVMEYLRNVQDLVADGQTPHERRSNCPFEGPIIPYGAEVKIYPAPNKRVGLLRRTPIFTVCAECAGRCMHQRFIKNTCTAMHPLGSALSRATFALMRLGKHRALSWRNRTRQKRSS